MKFIIGFLLFCLLVVICWPIALLALILLPFVWLITLPIQLMLIVIGAAFALFKAILFLPARLLGCR
jgi:hypothetical protein